ncbi:DUF86 domain-containing protein [Candidatus Wolfebacteria bacterium]|nr:DUF86 domain-containing protein [Candidatus Wolfebacteria bacterium]
MTFSKSFILEKLIEVEKYETELENFLEFSDAEILNDSGKMHIAERLLQLIVDIMIDANQHLIKELKLEAAEDFQSTFYILGRSGVLSSDFAARIAPVVGLRNRVVHGYETLNKELFIKSLRENRKDFKHYVKALHEYLEKI